MSRHNIKDVLSYNSWVHAVSGATGSVFAMGICYPLDTVRAHVQLEKGDLSLQDKNTFEIILKIFEEDGLNGLYRGLGPILQSLSISNFVYFYTFHGLKSLLGNEFGQQHPLKDLLIGAIAGVVNVLTTTPFWVVATRLKMKGVNTVGHKKKCPATLYDTLIGGLVSTAKAEGIAGLWCGTTASLMLVCNPALQFMMYESIKRKLIGSNPSIHLSGAAIFLIGALSKAFATLLTYPIQLIQTQFRAGKKPNDKDYPKNPGLLNVFAYIFRKEGIKGLYRGIEAKLLQTVIMSALMFSMYEKIVNYVTNALTRQTRVKF